ncbi:MAG: transferrin-binding protein-like solute binding protein, partial [Proteobacteria bacterium]|nr:transferrin-binding protein-like solute binding protein [Pseudomonadota bacterium]
MIGLAARASLLVLAAASLAACGGESGGTVTTPTGTPVVVNPNFTVGAPAAGTLGGGAANPVASSPGPSLTGVTGVAPADNTAFSLQQSAISVSASTITADAATNSQGATVTIAHASPLSLVVSIPALAISSLALADAGPAGGGGSGAAEAYTAGISGGRTFELDARHLNYINYGAWSVYTTSQATGLNEAAAFISGYHSQDTSSDLIGTTTTATYNGQAYGLVAAPNGTGWKQANLAGTATLTVDFGKNSLTGALTGLTATPTDGSAAEAWNTVNLTGTLSGANYSGSTSSGAAPTSGTYGLAGTATGHLDGGFYGPTEQETGAIWTLTDGTKSALGVLAGSINTGGGGTGAGIVAVTSGAGAITITVAGGGIQATPTASAGGPSFHGLEGGGPVTAPPPDNTIFLLNETALTAGAAAGPGLNPGPTLTFTHVDPATGKASLTLSLAALGSDASTVVLTDLGAGDATDAIAAERFGGSVGGKAVGLSLRHLDYTALGAWDYNGVTSAWVAGYQTPGAAVPTTGSATYTGSTYGAVTTTAGATTATLAGDASLSVNFANGQV